MARGRLLAIMVTLVVVVVVVFPLTAVVGGEEFVVGDDAGWNSGPDYYAWVDAKTFHVGDVLVFKYTKEDHNVIVVDENGYEKCLSSPNQGTYDSGNDRIRLETVGSNYYICQWHCDYSDQKLNITVLPKI